MAANKLEFILEAQQKALVEIEKVSAALEEMAKKTEKVASAGESAGIGFGKLTGSITVANLATSAIKGLANAGLDLVESSLSAAAGAESVSIAYETMIGNASLAEETLKQLYDFAKTTPFTATGITETGKLLLAMGISAQELLPTMKSLGDVAAGLNVPIEQIALAYGQVRSANQLYGTELRQFVQAGVPILAQLASQFGVNEAAAKKMVEEGKVGFKDVEEAFKSLSGEGGRFENLMVKMSGTVTGKFSNIVDSSNLVKVAFGKALTPATKVLEDAVIDLLGGMQNLFVTSDGDLRPEMQKLSTDLAFMAGVTADAVPVALQLSSALLAIAEKATAAGKDLFYFAAQLKNVFDLTAGTVATGIGAGFEAATNSSVSWQNALTATLDSANEEINQINDTYVDYVGTVDYGVGVSGDATNANEQLAQSFAGVGGGSSGASDKVSDFEKSMKKLGDAYEKVQDKVNDAMKDIKEKTADALKDVEQNIQDVATKMEEATAGFMKDTQSNNQDFASAYVEQEQNIKDLTGKLQDAKDELQQAQTDAMNASTPDQQSNANSRVEEIQANIAAIQSEIDKEQAGLDEYKDKAIQLSAEIEEARRYASLTTFQQTAEDLQKEQDQRAQAYQDEMQRLADELTALTEQKQKILLVETAVLNAINRLRENAANIYEGILQSMEDQTVESVNAMIEALNSLAERAGQQGGTNVGENATNLNSDYISQIASSLGVTTASSSTTVQIGDINITGTVTSAEDATAYAQQIIDEITRQLELANLGSS